MAHALRSHVVAMRDGNPANVAVRIRMKKLNSVKIVEDFWAAPLLAVKRHARRSAIACQRKGKEPASFTF